MSLLLKSFWNFLEKGSKQDKTNEQINDVLITRNVSLEALGDVAKEEDPATGENTESEDEGGETEEPSEGDSTQEEESLPEGEGEESDELPSDDQSGEDEPEDDSGEGSSGLEPSILPDETKPGENPFRTQNGKLTLIKQIHELESNIDSTIEYLTEIPKISSVVVNGFMELKEIVHYLIEIVHVVPLEEALIRYTLCVRSYDLQVKNLNQVIGKTINMEEK